MVKKLIFLLAHADSELKSIQQIILNKNDIVKEIPSNVIDNSIIV